MIITATERGQPTVTDRVSRKERIIQRLQYLWIGELFDSVFLPACVLSVAYSLGQSVGIFVVGASALLMLMLWQVSAYWRLKLRAVRSGDRVGISALRAYAVLEKVNWGLLGALPVIVLAVRLFGHARASAFDIVVGSLVYILALLEQINYYYVQLMYDNRADWQYLRKYKHLKKASLRRDLERLAAQERVCG